MTDLRQIVFDVFLQSETMSDSAFSAPSAACRFGLSKISRSTISSSTSESCSFVGSVAGRFETRTHCASTRAPSTRTRSRTSAQSVWPPSSSVRHCHITSRSTTAGGGMSPVMSSAPARVPMRCRLTFCHRRTTGTSQPSTGRRI